MNAERMNFWKERLGVNESAYASELGKMDHREDMFRGKYKFKALTSREDKLTGKDVVYVYNALAENIEAQVSSDIPMPKVTARRKQDERLAVILENMLRNELDRLPMESINDIAERVVPLQGGGFYLAEWDNTRRTHGTVGENTVSFIHPKWVIPQDGVYTSVQDMDYVILKLPQTKERIRARYGVDVEDEAESEPDIKDPEGGATADDMVTQYVAYYRNDKGGIGKYSWCNNVELEDLSDYQARRLRRCGTCGAAEPMDGETFTDGEEEPKKWHEGEPCPACGGREWVDAEEEYEEVQGPIVRSDGSVVPGTEGEIVGEPMPLDGGGAGFPGMAVAVMTEPGTVKVPYYKPDMFPLVLQRNVSVFGRLLGESDADKMEPQQDAINRIEQKILDRQLKAGTKITLPDNAAIRVDTRDQDVWRIGNAADLALIRDFNFTGDISPEMEQAEQVYQHMRQTVGITDSYQGRIDRTATSGTAKEFAAAQAAGRMESKRIMKQRAYSELFEMMFKFRLAYADEPRPVVYQDGHGDTVYDTFSKWDFLERDEDGKLWWNDQFLFSCDTTAPLATNRERLWQETTGFFTAGAFGDPAQTETQVEYWRKMELLHYPGAGETRANLQERLQREQQQMQQQAAMSGAPVRPAEMPVSEDEIEERARQAAMSDVQAQITSQYSPQGRI